MDVASTSGMIRGTAQQVRAVLAKRMAQRQALIKASKEEDPQRKP